MSKEKQPRYELSVYRDFIREATAYVSLVIGRRLKAKDAEALSDDELLNIALIIDGRVDDLDKSRPPR